MRISFSWPMLLCIGLLVGCSNDSATEPASSDATESGDMTTQATIDEPSIDLGTADAEPVVEETPDERPAAAEITPEQAIAAQLALLKQQDVELLKLHFTQRLRDSITADAVAKAQNQAAGATVDQLVDTVEMGEDGGKATAKIIMPGGRSLTTLIMIDGQWQADTIWFQ